MFRKLRERADDRSGFALIELLVVLLVLGALAAIALPTFFNQRDKAQDSEAKTAVRTARTAIETYSTEHDESYLGATPAALIKIEEALTNVPGAALEVGGLSERTYSVSVTSGTGNRFTVSRGIPPAADGEVVLTCDTAGTAGCPSDGRWN